MGVSAVIEYNKSCIYCIIFTKKRNIMRVSVAANVAVGFKHGDVVLFVKMVAERITSNATAYDCDFHLYFLRLVFF